MSWEVYLLIGIGLIFVIKDIIVYGIDSSGEEWRKGNDDDW